MPSCWLAPWCASANCATVSTPPTLRWPAVKTSNIASGVVSKPPAARCGLAAACALGRCNRKASIDQGFVLPMFRVTVDDATEFGLLSRAALKCANDRPEWRDDMKNASRCLVVGVVLLSAAAVATVALARGGGRAGGRGLGGASGNLCLSSTLLDISLSRIDLMVKPSGTQKAALEELKKFAKEYSDTMTRAC